MIILPYTAKLLNQHWAAFYKEIFLTLVCCLINAVLAFVVIKFLPVSGWFSIIYDAVIIALFAIIAEVFLLWSKSERNKVIHLIKRK